MRRTLRNTALGNFLDWCGVSLPNRHRRATALPTGCLSACPATTTGFSPFALAREHHLKRDSRRSQSVSETSTKRREETRHGQGNSVRLRHRCRCGRRLARLLWRRGFARTTFRAACSPAKSASPRLLKLFERLGIKTTWFIPGHSIETFPEQMKAVADAGHEIGMHGYTHENPIAMTPEQEEEVLDKCIELVDEALRQAADRLCRAVVGVLATSPTSCC